RVRLRLASYTLKSTSLGTVLKVQTTRAFGILFASSSAPDEMRPTTSPLSSSFIGSEQVTMTLPARSPVCFSTSSNRDQCTARREGVCLLRGLAWCARPRSPAGFPRKLLQLFLSARMAEYDVVPGTREDRSELAAHQSRTQNADSHRCLSAFCCWQSCTYSLRDRS